MGPTNLHFNQAKVTTQQCWGKDLCFDSFKILGEYAYVADYYDKLRMQMWFKKCIIAQRTISSTHGRAGIYFQHGLLNKGLTLSEERIVYEFVCPSSH